MNEAFHRPKSWSLTSLHNELRHAVEHPGSLVRQRMDRWLEQVAERLSDEHCALLTLKAEGKQWHEIDEALYGNSGAPFFYQSGRHCVQAAGGSFYRLNKLYMEALSELLTVATFDTHDTNQAIKETGERICERADDMAARLS